MRVALLLVLFTTQLIAADKPVPVAEAASKFTVPPGFNVTLFAGEPDVVQPIAFTFDDRGRMWVVECLSYPKWRADGMGKDRVIILEDVDGDGKHDKRTVVIDNGSNLSGIELGFGGMYLCSTPNLIFVPIKDDKPSGPPQILLDGWNLKEAKHNVFNSLIWGPDGWLYGCNGIQTKSWVGAPGTPQDKRTYMDCGVWKFHPTRKVFEVVATGTTNPWGLDFDEYGEMFITNCVIDHLFHVVPGGRYQRMYGQDPNPYAFDLMKSAVDYRHWAGGHWTESRFDKATGTAKKEHGDAGGGHAHSGCAIYLGDNFPKEYRNTLFTCNIHGNRLNNDGLERTSSGMKGVRRPDFAFANDPWFRGICVKQGPEGALYVSDWSDTGECHNYDVADTSNGRIYRIAYGAPKKFAGDVSTMTDGELWQSHKSKNEWLVRKARRNLQERKASGKNVETPPAEFVSHNSSRTEEIAFLRGYWTRFALGQPGFYGGNLLPESVRIWSARQSMVAYEKDNLELVASMIRPNLLKDESAAVRAAVANSLPRRAPADAFNDALTLFKNVADNADDKLTQLYWLGIQPAVLSKPDEALKLVNSIAIRRVRTNIVRLVSILPNTSLTEQLQHVLPLLESAPNDDTREDILKGILAALDDRKSVAPPKSWVAAYAKLSTERNPAIRELADDLALKFGDDRAVALLSFQAANDKLPTTDRVRAIEKLLRVKPKDFAGTLQNWLNDVTVRGVAIRGLAGYSDASIASNILAIYSKLTEEEKTDAILTLASRPKFAALLLQAVEKGTIPKSDISAFAARQIVSLNDKSVTEQLGKVWGTVKAANANRVEQTTKIKRQLTPDVLAKANLETGKALYVKQCAACHKLFGEGGEVGPELTGSQRSNLDYILENVLDPNAVVPFDYKMTQLNLVDGRVVTGLIKNETAIALTVRTVNEQLIISKVDIESRKPTNNSVMPEGLFDALKDDELRDLIAYLQKK